MEKRYTISVHDINGKALGVLYDSGSHQSGSAYNIKITKEVSGWKEMSFVLPMRDDDGNENWRAQFIRNENKIYVKAEGEEEDVYLIKEPVGLHDSNKISVTVNASHISEELKTKNLYKYFDDENGIGKCSDLIEKAIGGTGWTLGECDTFYEADGTTEKIRSYSCDSKTGAYNMISGICELFYARPVFHGNRVVDIVSQKSTDGWLEANFGMNLTKIQKTYDSSNLVTRLYVEGEYGDFGYVGIDDVNPTGLPFILDFDYYKNLGVFTNAHQAALDAFVRDYKTYSDQISSKTTEMLKNQSTLNNLISSFGYAYYPVVNGAVSAANRILGSDITDENAELKTGDSVAVVKTDYSYEYKEYPVASLTGVRAIIKFHPTITGSMGANEDMLEASVANVSTFLNEINDVLTGEGKPKTTVAGLKSTYGVTNLETIKSGSFDLSGIPSPYNEDPILEYSYQIGKLETEQSTIRTRLKEYMKTVCESIVNIDSLKKQIAQAVENQAVAENTFATAMGSMLRDGYWSDDNYAPGQEQSLYADALEISKKLAFPIVSYSATIEDLSHAPLCKIEYDEDGKPEYMVDNTYHKELSFNLAQVVRIYDGDMPYNDYAVTTKVVECVDNPTSNSCELQSDLSDIGQKTFASILERVTEMAEKVRQNKDIYERAVAISKDGKIDTSTLEGAIDVLKTKLMSTVSNWKTDANGNIIFESLDGSSAMMLTGNGFMCAASKKEDGSWNWRTFGTGEGFTADMIVTGFLDADRIKANSITVKKLASDVGSGLDISSNESITSIVGDVAEANSKITQTKDKIEWLVSGDGTTQQFVLTENGLKAIADDIDLSANNSITSYVGTKIGEVNETINQQASDFAGIVTGINKDIEGLQDQVDGSITTWFYPTAPTNENEPAQKWTTIDEKNIHLGDLYYDTVTGYCYRWQVKDNAYSWQKITDTDVTKALEDAAGAQDTANKKRRVFVVKPTPPYDVGDLWVQGADGDIMRCKTAKISGQSYADADWVKCSKYTDDTQANAAMTQITQTKESVEVLANRTTDAEDRITSAEASLKLKADSATLEAVSKSVDTLSGRVGEAESKLELKADSATLSVMETNLKQYTNNAVDGINIGGRNLLRNTNQGAVNWDWSMQTGGKTVEEYLDGGVRAVKMTRDAVEQAGWSVITYAISEDTYAHLEPNTEYTLSFDYKPSVATANGIMFAIKKFTGADAASGDGGYWKEIPANEWTHVSGQFTTAEEIPAYELNSYCVYITRLPTTVNSVHIFKNLKLEKGNKATDWSPAPEDVEGDVSALEQRMSAAELKITADAIVSTVTSSASYKTLSSTANTAKSTADTAKSKADGNATDITGLKTRMTTAESKIDQKADSITLSVLETKVDGIAIGGRNLLFGTNQGTYRWGWSMQTGGKTIEEYLDGGVRAVRMTRDATPNAGWSVISYNMGANDYALLEPNTEYTLSFDYKPSVATANGVMFSIRRGDGSNAATNEGGYWKEIPANKWTHVSGTFMTVENIPDFLLYSTEIYITRLPTTVNSVHIFKNLKLEKGNKATDWSPAPEDPAGSLSVNSDYSKVDINKDRVRIVSKRMEVAVPSEDGEDDVLRVDADGVHAEVVEADLIVSDSVVHTQGAASYTPANAGELAEILEGLKNKHLTGDVNINCSGITSGSYAISNVSGSGRVIFSSTGAAVFNSLHIENCGETIVSLYKIGLSNAEDALTVDRSYGVIVSTCAINARVGIRIGTSISTPGRVTMDSCTGDCTYVCAANFGSALRCIGASKPTGWLYLLNGSEVYNTTSDPTFEPASAPSIPTTQTVTVSLSPTSTSTSGYGSKLYQGRYSSSQSLRKGVMLFALPSDLTSADKIDSATLTIKRIGGVGQGGGVSVHVRCYDVTGTLYASKTAYENQTVSIDVTNAVKAMKTSGYTGLMLYNPDTTTAGSKSYTASYARFAGKGESGAPVLKVSYRK